MEIRRFLRGCFGGNSGKVQVIKGNDADFELPRSSSASLKNEKLLVETRRLCDSSISTAQAPVRRTGSPIQALCVVAKHTYGLTADIPYPSINTSDEVIIRTIVVGLNPIDWKSVAHNFCMPSFPWIGGREVAGTVEAVGSNVRDFKIGDRVWASTYYRDRRARTFQEFCVVPQHTVLLLPATLSFESGACLGVAALTAAMTIWKWLKVAMPAPRCTTDLGVAATAPMHILIWGGSTVTGQFAIQLAHQSGLRIIAVTSAKTRLLAERLGAEHVITRDQKTNDEVVAEIRAITGDCLTMAIDIVGNTTGACCLNAMSRTRTGVLAPLAFLKDGEQVPENITIAPVEMKRFIIEEGNRKYAEALNRLVEDKSVSLPEIEVLHGLERVEEGLGMLKRGDMNGRKLIVRVA